jgi:glycine dehydrogenase subunit 1
LPAKRKHESPEPLDEWDLNRLMAGLSGTVAAAPEYNVYTGAGSYEHHIPQVVPYLLSRSEFVTSYTPYQPEMSQGTLQAIYEFQTLSARLLGMEVSNASMYDGASALAEALLMALRVTRKRRVAVSRLIHPHFRRVVQTYLCQRDMKLSKLPYLPDGGPTSPLQDLKDLAALAVSPQLLRVIEDSRSRPTGPYDQGALFIATFTEPGLRIRRVPGVSERTLLPVKARVSASLPPLEVPASGSSPPG